jgi:hypothetical protein
MSENTYIDALVVQLAEEFLSVLLVEHFESKGNKGGVNDVTPVASDHDAISCLLLFTWNERAEGAVRDVVNG